MENRVELTEAPIDPAAILPGLATPADGAVALFLGTVRDHNEGREVRRLEYHAYPEMALRTMRAIAAATRARHGVTGIVMIHRTGTLEIGEVAVLVAACAPHRAAAFDACREAMERVKHEVPIWKKEHFEGGEAWVEGCASPPETEG